MAGVMLEADLRLDVRCPRCHHGPQLRITEAERELSKTQDPAELKQTYDCHRCGQRYEITAEAFHRAAA